MTILDDGPVGVRNGTTPVRSSRRDQEKIIALLDRIAPASGGPAGVWTRPAPGADFKCPPALAAAIKAFQLRWVPSGEIGKADGVVDPRGRTLAKLDALAVSGPLPVGPGGTNPDLINGMSITQMRPEADILFPYPRVVIDSVYDRQPIMAKSLVTSFFEFLLKIEKTGRPIGRALPHRR